MTKDQKLRLENACINKDGTAAAKVAEELGRPVIRCPKCQATNWLYPHILHMKEKHGVSNYFKTISDPKLLTRL